MYVLGKHREFWNTRKVQKRREKTHIHECGVLHIFVSKSISLRSFMHTFPVRTVSTVPKVIDFPRYNMICSGENVILLGIVHVVSGFPVHFMFYRRSLDCFSNSVSHMKNL